MPESLYVAECASIFVSDVSLVVTLELWAFERRTVEVQQQPRHVISGHVLSTGHH